MSSPNTHKTDRHPRKTTTATSLSEMLKDDCETDGAESSSSRSVVKTSDHTSAGSSLFAVKTGVQNVRKTKSHDLTDDDKSHYSKVCRKSQADIAKIDCDDVHYLPDSSHPSPEFRMEPAGVFDPCELPKKTVVSCHHSLAALDTRADLRASSKLTNRSQQSSSRDEDSSSAKPNFLGIDVHEREPVQVSHCLSTPSFTQQDWQNLHVQRNLRSDASQHQNSAQLSQTSGAKYLEAGQKDSLLYVSPDTTENCVKDTHIPRLSSPLYQNKTAAVTNDQHVLLENSEENARKTSSVEYSLPLSRSSLAMNNISVFNNSYTPAINKEHVSYVSTSSGNKLQTSKSRPSFLISDILGVSDSTSHSSKQSFQDFPKTVLNFGERLSNFSHVRPSAFTRTSAASQSSLSSEDNHHDGSTVHSAVATAAGSSDDDEDEEESREHDSASESEYAFIYL